MERKRKQDFARRYHTDAAFAKRINSAGVAHFKANKSRIYARRLERKPETGERDKKYIREWQRNRRRSDPQYNIGNRLRSRVWHAVTSGGGKKAAKTMELVGCTIAELRTHLESLFTEGMTWEKFMAGEIHIDHKHPCARFDLTDPEQQRACFHHSNLQPLWAIDNLSKGDRVAP